MSRPYGRPFRGEYDNTPGAGVAAPIFLFDVDGNPFTLGSDERLDITDVSYRSTAATTIRVFFDSLIDGNPAQPFSPTVTHTPAGTTIAAGTYTFYVTYFDPFTGRETVRSTGQAVTTVLGDNITVTAHDAIPAYMKDQYGNLGYIKVYLSGTGLVGQSLPGTNTLTLTTLTNLGPESAISGTSAGGKVVGGAFLPVNGFWSDCFETGKLGQPGIVPKFVSSIATPVMIHLSGRILKNAQLP